MSEPRSDPRIARENPAETRAGSAPRDDGAESAFAMELGARLREDIRQRGLTLDQASAAANKSVAYFSLVTQGKRTPKVENLEEIILQFGLDIRRYWRWVTPEFLFARLQRQSPPIPHDDPFWQESGLLALRTTPEPSVTFVTELPEEQVRQFEREDFFVLVPLVDGSIACGPPSQVADQARGYQPVYHTIVRRNVGPFSCVRCEGTSMEPLLSDGSLCIIDHGQREPRRLRGELVALNVDGGCTIKRLRLDSSGRFLLGIPENPDADVVTLDLTYTDTNPIIGKVIWSDRYYA